jgi:hypothetical protein
MPCGTPCEVISGREDKHVVEARGYGAYVGTGRKRRKTVSEWIRRPVALFVVSVLLVALAAGAALAAVVQCVPGATTCQGTSQVDPRRLTEALLVERREQGLGEP